MARVLIVEDEGSIAFYLEAVLQAAGYEVLGPYAREPEALNALQNASVDVALLDVSLGAGNGYGIADALWERRVPFMFLTGYDRSNLPEQYRECWHLNKPLQEGVLLSRLRKLLADPAWAIDTLRSEQST